MVWCGCSDRPVYLAGSARFIRYYFRRHPECHGGIQDCIPCKFFANAVHWGSCCAEWYSSSNTNYCASENLYRRCTFDRKYSSEQCYTEKNSSPVNHCTGYWFILSSHLHVIWSWLFQLARLYNISCPLHAIMKVKRTFSLTTGHERNFDTAYFLWICCRRRLPSDVIFTSPVLQSRGNKYCIRTLL